MAAGPQINNRSLFISNCFYIFAISATSASSAGNSCTPNLHQNRFSDLFGVTRCVSAGVSLSHTAIIISCEAQGEGTALLTDPFKGNTVESEMKVGQEKRPKLKRAAAASALAHRRLAPLGLPPQKYLRPPSESPPFSEAAACDGKTPTEDSTT